MNQWSNPAACYTETSVSTSSPVRVVVLLYEGAIRFIRQAATDIENGNLVRKRQSIDRSLAIIQHLQGSLDVDRGEAIAAQLDNLYIYVTSCVLEGSTKLDVRPLNEAAKLLTTLLTAWEEVAQKENQPLVPANLLASTPAGPRLQLHG